MWCDHTFSQRNKPIKIVGETGGGWLEKIEKRNPFSNDQVFQKYEFSLSLLCMPEIYRLYTGYQILFVNFDPNVLSFR